MAQVEGESSHWRAAVDHAGLGLPVARDAKMRLAKRIVARLLWPFLRHQVEFNREVLAVLVEVRNALAEDIRSLDDRSRSAVARADAVTVDVDARLSWLSAALDGVASRLESRGWTIDAMGPVIEQRGYALAATEHSLDQLKSEVEGLRGLVERGEREAFARLHDGIGSLRRELGELTLSVEARFERLDTRSATDA